MPFAKGQSGNPAGRPRKNEEMRAALRRALAATDATGQKNKDAVAQALVREARNGNVLAVREIFDRIDGKVKDETAVDHGGKIEVEVTYSRRPHHAGTAGASPGPAGDQG